MSKTNRYNTPGGTPNMLENPPSLEADPTDSGVGGAIVSFCKPVVDVASSESSPSERQQSEETDAGC